ncbi:MAG: hypothetical protein HY596_02370 [Candidatus Omnitrophica bacterium]|nr:hypothetical protein [Candidatus Omnitrophota bacterium]
MADNGRRWLIVGCCVAGLVMAARVPAAGADDGLLGGVADIVTGALSIPAGAIAGTLNGPPILGTVTGTLLGALNTLSLTSRGVLRLAGAVVPLVARLAPLLPVFL